MSFYGLLSEKIIGGRKKERERENITYFRRFERKERDQRVFPKHSPT